MTNRHSFHPAYWSPFIIASIAGIVLVLQLMIRGDVGALGSVLADTATAGAAWLGILTWRERERFKPRQEYAEKLIDKFMEVRVEIERSIFWDYEGYPETPDVENPEHDSLKQSKRRLHEMMPAVRELDISRFRARRYFGEGAVAAIDELLDIFQDLHRAHDKYAMAEEFLANTSLGTEEVRLQKQAIMAESFMTVRFWGSGILDRLKANTERLEIILEPYT